MDYELIEVSDPADWLAYHAIRRQELFEARGRHGIYDPDLPGEYLQGMHPYLLKQNGQALGTTRLDVRNDATAVFRLVAVTAAEQGKGHGRALGRMVEARARAFGARMALVNAAASAVGYYEKTGWSRHIWDVAELASMGSDCIQMRKAL
jgi:GNAT superfamily N-acetyltransferase